MSGFDVRRGPTVSDANRLRVLKNAYVTTGRALQKRPGARKIAVLEPGTVGLKAGNGKLQTFYESGSISHANSLFLANKVPHPTLSQAVKRVWYGEVFLGFMYAAIEYADGTIYHHYMDGTFPPRVTDVNCPNSKAVKKAASKIFATGPDTVRFCKTNNPRDWTTGADAGFLPVGIQQDGSVNPKALGQFQGKIVVFFSDGMQVWVVDPDPAKMVLQQKIYGLGTLSPLSPASFALDVFFKAKQGFRSITLILFSDNMQDVDVGTPIDALVTQTDEPISLYVPGFGQFWCFLGNIAWIYSFSRTAKIAAWSQYVFPFTIDDAAALDSDLYVRNGNNVYILDRAQFNDDGAGIPVQIEGSFLDFKQPGILKQVYGMDIAGIGTPQVAVRFDPRNSSLITDLIDMPTTVDTSPGTMKPFEITATNFSPVINHNANEDFRLDMLRYYFNTLGPI